MGKKRFINDITNSIIGMTFEDAKVFCLYEGYQLYSSDDKPSNLNITYIITVKETDADGKIIRANYGI